MWTRILVFVALSIVASQLCDAQTYCYNQAGTLNFRSGPGTTYSIIMSIPSGSSMQYLGNTQYNSNDGYTWINVQYSGSNGWVANSFVTQCGGGNPPPPPPPPPPSGGSDWTILPISGAPLYQFYGHTRFAHDNRYSLYAQCQGMHNGLDFGATVGTAFKSVCNGLVVHAGDNSPFAAGPRSIIVMCGNNYVLYGHTSSESVSKGQTVTVGQTLGATGYPSSPHLHFEVRPVPSSVRGNMNAWVHPVNPGTSFNPRTLFYGLDSYFNSQSETWCTGNASNQPNINFGGPINEAPCQ